MKSVSIFIITLVMTMLFTITSYAGERADYTDTIRLYLTTLEIKETYENAKKIPVNENERRLIVIKNNLKEIIKQDSELLGAQYILNKLNNPNYTLVDFINDEEIQSKVRKDNAPEWASNRMSMLPEFSGYGAERLLLAEIKFSLFAECLITMSDDICLFYAGLAELTGFSLYTPAYLEAKEKYGVDTIGGPVWEPRSFKPAEMVIETFYEDPMTWVYPVQYRNNR